MHSNYHLQRKFFQRFTDFDNPHAASRCRTSRWATGRLDEEQGKFPMQMLLEMHFYDRYVVLQIRKFLVEARNAGKSSHIWSIEACLRFLIAVLRLIIWDAYYLIRCRVYSIENRVVKIVEFNLDRLTTQQGGLREQSFVYGD